MERYLEGEEIDGDERRGARSRTPVTRGELFPVACGVATQNLGTTALLDLIVEGVPSPARQGAADRAPTAAPRPSSSRRSPTRSPGGSPSSASSPARSRPTRRSSNPRTHGKERLGQLLLLQGKEHQQADEFGAGDIGAVAKLKETHDRRPARSTTSATSSSPPIDFPRARDELRGHAEGEGRRGQGRHGAAPPRRGGPDARAAPRRADRRAAARRA